MKGEEQAVEMVELGGGITKVFDVVGDRIIALEGEVASLKGQLEEEKRTSDVWYKAYQRERELGLGLRGKLDALSVGEDEDDDEDDGEEARGAEHGFALADARKAAE